MIPPALYLGGALLAALVLVWLLVVPPPSGSHIYDLFHVPCSFKIAGQDLGGKSGMYLRARGITGVPDCVFMDEARHLLIAGEYKSRTYRNRVRARERYQLVLYMGLLAERYPGWDISGVLAFRDHAIPVTYRPAEFERLVAWVPEYRRVAARLGL